MKALSPRSDSRRAGTDDAPHRNGHARTGSSSHKPGAPHGLDPFGIYGTRTAHRMRAARRRRTTQNLILLFLLLAGAAVFFLASRIQHTPVFSSTWQRALMVTPAAAPVWASDAGESRLLIPTDNGLLLSVDAHSGEARKIFATAFPLRAQPVIVDNAAFIACEDGTLYVVDWRSGRHLWSYPTRAAMTARPALTKILLPAPIKKPNSANANPADESNHRAMDKAPITAAPVAALSPVASGVSPRRPDARPAPMPKLVPKLVIITGNDEGLVTALEAGNGRVLWKRHAGAPVGNGITTATIGRRPLVLVPLLGGLATRGGLWCLDARTGAPLWKFPQKSKAYSAQLSAPAVELSATGKSGRVYCVDDGGAVVCLDLLTGRWDRGGWKTFTRPVSSTPPDAAVVLRGEPAVWGKHLIVGGNDGGVRCFATDTGRLEWIFNAGAAVRCRPYVLSDESSKSSHELVLIGCDGPMVYALNLQDGAPVWKFRTTGRAFAGLVIAGQNLLVLSGDGVLERFKLPD